ncbi:SURF1 family protein [Sulfitobacter noctilucicola]|uniref:SURF1-like protein n=1 Tax=Sulfitobacter noctilucicola TaxID=1342301 RepID=A0A7W6M8Z2_9RHOB|nr:SURF1 family protein [Sulfitobacter noctilucicola]MBB4174649.1 surfeit locus 1 family protein [Sulfitobacter noctilucicola]
MNRALFLLVIGLGGAAILVALGVWQVQRLAWKEGVIATIDARILDAPVALPETPDPDEDAYLPVAVTGKMTGETLRVLVSQKDLGAGYRLITALELRDRRVLLDRGFIVTGNAGFTTPVGEVTVTGNLQWPQETDSYTPEPDINNNIWFARDVQAMADLLGTEPVMVVARTVSEDDPAISPFPVDTSRIPNDHLQYAITWFSLAAIWLAMSLLFLRRRRAPKSES